MRDHSRNQITERTDGSPPSEAWLFAQAIMGNPIPRIVSPEAAARAKRDKLERLAQCSAVHAEELRQQRNAEAKARRERELLEWAAHFSTECQIKLQRLLREEAAQREAWRCAEQFSEALLITEWDEGKHPRDYRGRWEDAGRAGGGPGQISSMNSLGTADAGVRDQARSPFILARAKVASKGNHSSAARSAPRVPPRPTVNAEGVEVAGAGPETTQSYKDKVQKALETLNPDVARWWKANSVNGEIRSRVADLWQSGSRSWLAGDDQPIVEVDQGFTPGQTAQAIIAEVKDGWFADSIGVFYKKYKFARNGNIEEFRQWQLGATAEAAHLASVLAELYVGSIATLTPAGDLVVTLGDLAENGPRWDQLLSILPYVGHLPVAAIVLKLGKRQVKIPKAMARKLELLTDKERKSVLMAIAGAKTDDEAAAIVKREVAQLVGNRQIHHPISDVVHKALEKHPILKGKYQHRDTDIWR